ncbi:MAG: glyoxalase/bleomycin resistance/extradiol dioxygenase family protein [Deltaproteobacteria bacterium]|jgi:catechol 2,3-dioxygenase-like lactoylglutathione lyase family enzyme|nr:glyoxalase/bleomycin resistance/extradiol dioxygenase family protein [Deltaproteobacteria bacterium]
MRLQLALNVKDLDAAIDFYGKMFGAEVHKRKPGYANFAIDEPPLKLVLFESSDAPDRINHLGVEVFADEQVGQATDRLKAAGLETSVEDEATCCYAKQNKVWATEPDGLRWEWYKVVEDSETFFADSAAKADSEPARGAASESGGAGSLGCC